MCAYTCARTIVLILSSQPTQPLWWSTHVLCVILWGRNWGWGSRQVTKTPGVIVARLPRSQADPAIRHRTRGIDHHHHHHLTKERNFTHRKSAVSLTDVSYITAAHALAMCVPPATEIGSTWRTPRPHVSPRRDITAPYEPDWQAACLFSSSRRSPFPVLPLF